MNKHIITLPLLVIALGLSACSSGSQEAKRPESSMNPYLRTTAIDKVMENALAQAEASGNEQEILAMLKQIHMRSPQDPIVATRYARALREDDQINTAIRTLQPFTDGEDKNIEATTEMAMTQLSLGDFQTAEMYAGQATTLNSKNARAYLAMGTAQDAQGRHQDAEVSFREGLKHWKGDASPILNNLALNLASQGHLKESLALLEKAKKLAPNRTELERNRRIIATLLETAGPRPNAPVKKPNEDKNGAKTEVTGTEDKSEEAISTVDVSPVPTPKMKPALNTGKEPEEVSIPREPVSNLKEEEEKKVIPTYKASEADRNTKPSGTTKFNIKLKGLND